MCKTGKEVTYLRRYEARRKDRREENLETKECIMANSATLENNKQAKES